MTNHKRHLFTLLLILIGVGLLIAACGVAGNSSPAPATSPPAITESAGAPEVNAQNPTDLPAETQSSEITDVPVAVAPAPVDECLACHLDKQRLIDTAAPVEADLESESEGEG